MDVDVMLFFAVETAKWGWPVFPVRRDKTPYTPRGFKDATTDLLAVQELWRQHPGANIGVATGVMSFALDQDIRHGGDDALADLERRYGRLPETPRYFTGGDDRGMHVHFQADPRVTNARGMLPPGLDVRGRGGYVIIPPSVTQHQYRWEIGATPLDLPLAPAPEWLLALILTAPPHADDDDVRKTFAPGSRHEFLLQRGQVLCWHGYSLASIRAFLEVANQEQCQPPLPGPGKDGWHRLLPTFAQWSANGRARHRAEARARATIADEPVDDQIETVAEAEWSEPLPLDRLPVPPFPLEVLPPVLADFVADVAGVTQTPLDLVGVSVMTVIGACAARRVDVAIGCTHIEPLNLYSMIAAESGERKGPALRPVLAPVYELERYLRVGDDAQRSAASALRKLAEKRLERVYEQAARATEPKERERFQAEAVALAGTLPVVPPALVLVVSDRTVEKLEVELAQQGGALLLASEEAGTVIAMVGGRYNRDGFGQFDTVLKAYDRGEIDTGRITRDSVRCSTPELSILVTPQPIVLQQLRERPEYHHRGLLPRFLFAVPDPRCGFRPYAPTAAARVKIRVAFTAVLHRVVQSFSKRADGDELEHLLITGPALEGWAAYHDRVELELRPEGRLYDIREWGSKQAGRVARLAGILHLATMDKTGDRRIPVETDAAACRLGEYFEAHALAAYDAMAAMPRLDGARRLVAWIRRHQVTSFSARDAHRKLQSGFPTMEDVRPCLTLLVEYGYIREELAGVKPEAKRPSSPTYVVHPNLRQPS
jgi:replicative DNA helicase